MKKTTSKACFSRSRVITLANHKNPRSWFTEINECPLSSFSVSVFPAFYICSAARSWGLREGEGQCRSSGYAIKSTIFYQYKQQLQFFPFRYHKYNHSNKSDREDNGGHNTNRKSGGVTPRKRIKINFYFLIFLRFNVQIQQKIACI